jgi:hypothetical protein
MKTPVKERFPANHTVHGRAHQIKTAQRIAVLRGKGPVGPAFDKGAYLPFFLSCFATFFSLAVFVGCFLVCFFEFWVLAMFIFVLRLLFVEKLISQSAAGQ